MAKISVDQETCIGCGLCADTCPKSFFMKDARAHPINAEVKSLTCEENAKNSCPVEAISIDN